jgi:transcription elongation factor
MQSASAWRKSTRSSGTNDSNCAECRQTWRKGSRSSGTNSDFCVEARSTTGAFQVRDSKLGHGSPVFDLAAADFAGLLRAAR